MGLDARHAAVVDRAFPQQARAAFDGLAAPRARAVPSVRCDSSVAPNTATVGTPRAEAICIAAGIVRQIDGTGRRKFDEFTQTSLIRRNCEPRCPRAGAGRDRLAQRTFIRRTEHRDGRRPCQLPSAAASANRSGSQRLAFPYAAPGLMPITGPANAIADQPSAGLRAPPAPPSRRIASLSRKRSEINARVEEVPDSKSADAAGCLVFRGTRTG